MAADSPPPDAGLFPRGHRASGVLLHVTSLPSAYGVGDVGPGAIAWLGTLRDAGQRWWQALPLGPTGYGDSPYQPESSFAGNELLISPSWLIEDGVLRAGDVETPAFPASAVSYETVIPFKRRVVETAWANRRAGIGTDLRASYEAFCAEQSRWLDDYALFRALKGRYGGGHYLDWPTELVFRVPAALERVRRDLADEIDRVRFAQFLLGRQAARLRACAAASGIRLMGDLPFFVSPDSSDVWANPELFLLDEHRRPRVVAGVPPDYFSADGQLWGNPVYDWDAIRATGYRWCIDRVRALLGHVDAIRLDHFRGFAAAWHVPATARTARSGEWIRGPGAGYFSALHGELGALPFIAEDLGLITPDVHALRDRFGLPGTRVLQFAFDGNRDNPHLPENHGRNTVVYTGTHDNQTTREWLTNLPDAERGRVNQCLERRGIAGEEGARALIRLAWSSEAALAIAPLQDVLGLGREARMNVPGRAAANWRWRCTDGMLHGAPFEWLRGATTAADREGRPVAP